MNLVPVILLVFTVFREILVAGGFSEGRFRNFTSVFNPAVVNQRGPRLVGSSVRSIRVRSHEDLVWKGSKSLAIVRFFTVGSCVGELLANMIGWRWVGSRTEDFTL